MANIKITKEEFFKRVKEKHGEKYIYENVNFLTTKDKIKIICPIHGVFEQRVHSHLSGNGCSKCFFETLHKEYKLTTEDFIKKAKEVHGDKYDYSFVEYVDNTTKVKIICPIHGEFEQTPHHHKRGGECKKCGNIKTGKAAIENSRGWSLTDWQNKLNKTPNAKPILYFIKCFNGDETFYKIGITMRSIKKRFSNKILMPYQYEVLVEITNTPEIIFNGEIIIKQELKQYKFLPKIKFSGWYECFDESCEEILYKLINKHLK